MQFEDYLNLNTDLNMFMLSCNLSDLNTDHCKVNPTQSKLKSFNSAPFSPRIPAQTKNKSKKKKKTMFSTPWSYVSHDRTHQEKKDKRNTDDGYYRA